MKNLSKIKLNISLRDNKYLKNNKNLLIVSAVILGVVVVLVLLEISFGLLSISIYGHEKVKEISNAIAISQKQLKKSQEELGDVFEKEGSFIARQKEFWITERDGDVNQNFEEKITDAAKDLKIELSSVGTVQVNKVNDNLSTGEVDISCSGNTNNIIHFIYILSSATPKMYFERASFRPETTNGNRFLTMNCNVKFIIISNDEIVQLLGIGKKKND